MRILPGSDAVSDSSVATQPALLSVQPVCEEVVVRRWRSQVWPEIVVTDGRYDLPVLRWADAHPHVYKIADGTRSKVFGRNSCAHIGWAQRCQAPTAVFERVRTLHDALHDPLRGKGIFYWRAQFSFEHYEDKGFTGGVFFAVSETSRGYSDLLTLDYTPALIDEVARQFAAWARNHPRPVAIVVKRKGWKSPEVHRWDWEDLRG
jgi:hypothetical protein